MAYFVSQMRKVDTENQYMVSKNVYPSLVISQNPFGQTEKKFTDFALTANGNTNETRQEKFKSSETYFLRFKINKIPQYYYSGSRTASEVALYQADADNLNLQILLTNNNDSNTQTIGTCNVPVSANTNSIGEYSSFSFVFKPVVDFDNIVFKINRTSFDTIAASSGNNPPQKLSKTITGPRNWLSQQTIESFSTEGIKEAPRFTGNSGQSVELTVGGYRILYSGINGDVGILQDLVQKSNAKNYWSKMGFQSRPGALIVVNNQPIRVGRSGIYEINNGTPIQSFMIAAPSGNVDEFLLDYSYKEERTS